MSQMESVSATLQNIYGRLQDDLSRDIFRLRLDYFFEPSTANVWRLLDAVARHERGLRPSERHRPFTDLFGAAGETRVLLYGAGGIAASVAEYAESRGLTVAGVCDSSPARQGCPFGSRRLPIQPPEELLRNCPDLPVVVSSIIYEAQIYDALLQAGVAASRIYVSTFSEEQYWGPAFMKLDPAEAYIDCGAFDGQSVTEFYRHAGPGARVWALEPDPRNFAMMRERARQEGWERAELVPAGAWETDGTLSFSGTATSGAALLPGESGMQVPVVAIDSLVDGAPVTVIKMDIEGAETPSLRGAAATIVRCRPKLAVCVYHKPEDILDIPAHLLSLVPDYRLYLRHHSISANETVLYAIAP